MRLLVFFLFFFSLLNITSARKLYDAEKQNLVVFWGQGSNQSSLYDYCQKKNFEVVVLSFLNNLNSTHASFNFGNACVGPTCPQIEHDIIACQKLGIKVMLLIGGDATLGHYGFEDNEQGLQGAALVYQMFNPKAVRAASNYTTNATVIRPFGKAEIDGFDFDFENNNDAGLGTFVTELRRLWTTKTLLISATPQCPYPDKSTIHLLEDENAKVDFAFVQFYNNPACALSSSGFKESFETWKNFTTSRSGNQQNMKLFIGVCTACDNKYIVDIGDVENLTKDQRSDPAFGGYALWEATTASAKVTNGLDYISGLNNILRGKSLPTAQTKREILQPLVKRSTPSYVADRSYQTAVINKRKVVVVSP